MKAKVLILLMFCLLQLAAKAQQTTGAKHHKTAKKITATKPTKPLPTWASAHGYTATTHAYFPDYYTFYDPQRGGYLFWKDTGWTFTPTMPPYMENADLRKERVQLLKGLDLDLHPEEHYPYYMKMYPATHEYDMVPVPR